MINRILMIVALSLWPIWAQAADQPFDPFRKAGVDRLTEARAPLDVGLVDEGGHTTTLRALGRGKPIVLVPVQNHCPNLCGFTLEGLAQAVNSQRFKPGPDFQIVALGIDPREGPADARATAERLRYRLGLPDRSVGAAALVGEAARQVTRPLGYRYAWDPAISQYAHIAAVAVLAPDGRLARWLYGLQPQGDDLRLALTEAGEGRLGNWTDQLLLLCYHYDPKTGQYAGVIWTLLRLAGVVTLLGLGALIAVLLLRDQRRGRTP